MSVDPIFWLLAAIGFVVLEAMTLNLVSIWFAVGSAAALLSCLVTGSFRVQAVVFVAVSTLCLLALKPLCARLRKPPTATNGDRALGREAVALTSGGLGGDGGEAVALTSVSAEATGRVRLDGVDWNARCATPGDTLAPGQSCRVAEIHSTLLIVEPILTETAAPAAH